MSTSNTKFRKHPLNRTWPSIDKHSCFVSGIHQIQILACRLAILTAVSRSSEPLAKRLICSSFGHKQFIRHPSQFSLIIPTFYATEFELPTASLNKPEVNKQNPLSKFGNETCGQTGANSPSCLQFMLSIISGNSISRSKTAGEASYKLTYLISETQPGYRGVDDPWHSA
jgi:hypothetical protein